LTGIRMRWVLSSSISVQMVSSCSDRQNTFGQDCDVAEWFDSLIGLQKIVIMGHSCCRTFMKEQDPRENPSGDNVVLT